MDTAIQQARQDVEGGFESVAVNAGGAALNQTAQPVSGIAIGALTVQISAQWSAATTGNNIQLRQFSVTALY